MCDTNGPIINLIFFFLEKRNPAVLKIFSKFRHIPVSFSFVHLDNTKNLFLFMTNTKGLYIIAIAIEIHL